MKNKILPALLCLLCLSACSSVDLEPSDRYDMSYAFKNRTNAELYLDYFYKEIYWFSPFGSCALGGSNSNMSDGLTDILKYCGIVAGVGDCNLIMTVSGQQSADKNYFDAWTTCYTWTRRINEFLSGLDAYSGNFSSEEADRFRGEARFFRAWASFMMMRSHASDKDDLGIIIYDDISKMNSEGKNRARATVAESWGYIFSDIDFAVNALPEPSEAGGRVHRYAALALKARVSLYAKRYTEALDAVRQIRASNLYDYEQDYSQAWKGGSKEAIWQFDFSSGVLTHSFDQKYSQPGDICTSGSYGGGYAGPTQEFVDMYDNADGTPFDPSDISRRFITNDNVSSRDPRLAASVLYNGALWKGRALECYEGGVDEKYMPYGAVNYPGNSITGYYMRKLLDEDNDDFVVNGSYQSWVEFRYAEMTLIMAECLAAQGDYSGAQAAVAELRSVRFGTSVYTAPITSWDTALDVILKERAIELCFEDHRFWDLRRTGRARATLDGKRYTGVLWTKAADGSFTSESVSCDMGARIYPERFDHFPIPQTEISNNTLARQNSDW